MNLHRISSFRKRSLPGPLEIQNLLEFLLEPVLLVDGRDGRVLMGNQPAADLSGRFLETLADIPLATLFPHEAQKLFGAPRSARLAQASSSEIEVLVNPIALDAQREWWLLTLEDPVQRANFQAQLRLRAQLPDLLNDIHATRGLESLDEIVGKMLDVVKILLDIDEVVIYQVSRDRPVLVRAFVTGQPTVFPEELALGALARLQTTQAWSAQQPTTNALQRLARSNRLAGLVSAPLGQPNALMGLMVAAKQHTPPSEYLLLSIPLFARTLTLLFQNEARLKQMALDLEQQQQRLATQSAIQENIHDGVILVSPDFTILDLNPAAELLLGYASREAFGQAVENILIGEYDLLHSLEIARQMPLTYDAGDHQLYGRDGHHFLAHVRILPLMGEAQAQGWAILLDDLSQQEQFRIRTQQLEQRALLGEVTAVFAHEVRNPINNISTGLQLMSMALPPGDPQQEQIARLSQDCDRLAELMKSVLAFARPREYQFEILEIEAFMRRLLERWHPRLTRSNIIYALHVEAEAPPIRADQRALEQVFTNLITNAAQAMAETGGRLTLRVRLAPPMDGPPQVEISVADTGPGISEEVREHIFEPFFTTKASGTGLGLVITKQIITAHHGDIQVVSIPGGTAFQVRLPIDTPGPDTGQPGENWRTE